MHYEQPKRVRNEYCRVIILSLELQSLINKTLYIRFRGVLKDNKSLSRIPVDTGFLWIQYN